MEIRRGMTTSATAIFVPFITRELRMGGQALYYGSNALSHNLSLIHICMDLGPLLGLFMQSMLISVAMPVMSIVIFVITYGRMLEVYMLTSLAPIPVATLSNRELGGTGQNYLRSLFAVGFQGLLILVCVAIYAVLIQGIATDGDPIGAIWGAMGYTVLLTFMPVSYTHLDVYKRQVVKTRMTDEEYADFTGRLAAYEISQSEFIRQAIRKATIRPIVTVSPVNDGQMCIRDRLQRGQREKQSVLRILLLRQNRGSPSRL